MHTRRSGGLRSAIDYVAVPFDMCFQSIVARVWAGESDHDWIDVSTHAAGPRVRDVCTAVAFKEPDWRRTH